MKGFDEFGLLIHYSMMFRGYYSPETRTSVEGENICIGVGKDIEVLV